MSVQHPPSVAGYASVEIVGERLGTFELAMRHAT